MSFETRDGVFVDAQDLARITKGSLSFEEDRIILTLPGPGGSSSSGDATKSGFSPPFMRAAIEAMASIREWGGMLHGDRPKWISRGEGHGRKHDSRIPGSSRRQCRTSLRSSIDRLGLSWA